MKTETMRVMAFSRTLIANCRAELDLPRLGRYVRLTLVLRQGSVRLDPRRALYDYALVVNGSDVLCRVHAWAFDIVHAWNTPPRELDELKRAGALSVPVGNLEPGQWADFRLWLGPVEDGEALVSLAYYSRQGVG